jgi:NAD(P)-dependent dehydrogenase (short-subunit alcohol dehydrogenase family)
MEPQTEYDIEPQTNMNNYPNFNDKVALVTGASSGMGLATALAFAEAGASVTLADVKEEAVREAAEKLVSAGHRALAIPCDVSNDAQVEAMVERTVAEFGRLDAAFNNAGVMPKNALTADSTLEEFDRVTRVNLRSVWSCMKHELHQMDRQGSDIKEEMLTRLEAGLIRELNETRAEHLRITLVRNTDLRRDLRGF